MPYVPGTGRLNDVYHSNNVFANFVPIALWLQQGGTDALVLQAMSAITTSEDYEKEKEVFESVEGESEDEYSVTQQQKVLIDKGVISQTDLKKGDLAGASPLASDPTVGTASSGTVTTATNLDTDIDMTVLYVWTAIPPGQTTTSTIYVKTVTKQPGVIFPYDVKTVAPENGLTAQEVCDNLKALVVNCWVPIKTQFPDAFITCSFRKGGVGSPTSQHPRGMAMDIQYASASKADYYTRAQWVKANVPYDQFILEYKTTGTGKPWHHISFNRTGNRGQCFTYMNDKNCQGPGVQGLFDLSNA
ncbi:MAG: hypothetical protein EBU90_07875 [Proteobacteria bacterium]|nr:hypothetical protein [Pseudomonadota bacterium]